MASNYSIISNDSYTSIAISSILDEILSNRVGNRFNYVNILIISDCSLWDVYQIYCRLDKGNHYILISSPHIFGVLSKTGMYNFIDISMPVDNIINKLYALTKHLEIYPTLSVISVQEVLSSKEKLVLKYLLRGVGANAIAGITGLHVKMVSAKKMRIMNKLKVSSVQQLYIKLKCIELFHEAHTVR
ncbi:helix-turn-helix domain-containing protein [Yersinia enterocolitica]|uniref:helix-turn-helix domain-containing protein n=1 Tax=Yersinia enterocolitica TaxID=630 RepID=UPI003AB40A7C